MILDGGPTPLGVDSTIVSLAGETPRLLRQGALPREAIEEVLGQKLAVASPAGRP
jgi:L-threonylcarbamoyladenylate synthase